MSNQENKSVPMTYEEAVKYIEEHGTLTKIDRINLESRCDWDKLSNYRASAVDKRYIEAVNVIKEHRVQEFIDYKPKLP